MCVCVCVSEEYVSEVNFTSSEDSSESQSRLGKEIPPDTEGPCRCLSMCVFVSQVKKGSVDVFFPSTIFTPLFYISANIPRPFYGGQLCYCYAFYEVRNPGLH